MTIIDTISDKDYNTIVDMVHFYLPHESFDQVFMRFQRMFKDITPAHYVVFGVLIGEISATETAEAKLLNILQLCQRQN